MEHFNRARFRSLDGGRMIAQTKSAWPAKPWSPGRCGVDPGEIIQFCRYSLGAGQLGRWTTWALENRGPVQVGVGRVAEWFKAPVLKTHRPRLFSYAVVSPSPKNQAFSAEHQF